MRAGRLVPASATGPDDEGEQRRDQKLVAAYQESKNEKP
jgi:hypothetical protein